MELIDWLVSQSFSRKTKIWHIVMCDTNSVHFEDVNKKLTPITFE